MAAVANGWRCSGGFKPVCGSAATVASIATTVIPAGISLLQDRAGDKGEHRNPGHEEQANDKRA